MANTKNAILVNRTISNATKEWSKKIEKAKPGWCHTGVLRIRENMITSTLLQVVVFVVIDLHN